MLAKRIIPCLDIKVGRVVKGVNFVNLRDAGDLLPCRTRIGPGDYEPDNTIELQLPFVRALLPDARLTLMEDAGHMIHHSRPDAVMAAIRRAATRAAR